MKRFLIVGICALGFLASCQQEGITEVKETAIPAETMIGSIVEVYSTFDVIDDFISCEDLLNKKQESLLPDLVSIEVLDSHYTNGSPAVVVLDFGPLGEQLPHGVLCKDNKYRAGKLKISVSASYGGAAAEVVVTMDDEEPFFTGNGESMQQMSGVVQLNKLGAAVYQLKCDELEIQSDEGVQLAFSCSNTIVKTEDLGEGIINDKVLIDGQFSIEGEDGSVFRASVAESLKKNYVNSCISNIIGGRLTMENFSSVSSISADFDPYDDLACDKIVSITINGKSSIHHY